MSISYASKGQILLGSTLVIGAISASLGFYLSDMAEPFIRASSDGIQALYDIQNRGGRRGGALFLAVAMIGLMLFAAMLSKPSRVPAYAGWCIVFAWACFLIGGKSETMWLALLLALLSLPHLCIGTMMALSVAGSGVLMAFLGNFAMYSVFTAINVWVYGIGTWAIAAILLQGFVSASACACAARWIEDWNEEYEAPVGAWAYLTVLGTLSAGLVLMALCFFSAGGRRWNEP